MKLSKIILYSDAKGRGVKPDACVEVSQRLTIMRDGHIWFTGYNYGDGFNSRRIIRRKRDDNSIKEFYIKKKLKHS